MAKSGRSGKVGKGKRSKRAQPRVEEEVAPTRPPFEWPSWAPWAGLAILLGIHVFLLRGVFNPAPHSGGDNAGYLTLAFSLIDQGAYLDLYDPAAPPHTKYPPGFPLLLAGAMLLGARTWAQFKVLSALAIFGTVALSVAWAWRRRGWEFALGVGLILSFSTALLYASQWILSDPLFMVLTLVALLAFDRAADETDQYGDADRAESSDATARPSARPAVWLAVGIAATVAAFFTRSAGLPLVVAVAAWLLWQRRFRSLAGFAVAFGTPAFLWWLRDKALGGPGYTGEFWLINPYQPELGQAGFGDLLGRVITNAGRYLGAHIPAGFVGRPGSMTLVLGILLFVLALVAWVRRMRNPRVAELFAPLYLGLILLWPEVWSGDRFALPLFPLIIFYAGETLLDSTRQLPRAGRAGLIGAALGLMIIPAAMTWTASASQSEICRQRVNQGPFACYASRLQEFVAAANWTTDNLGDDAVVFSRKPRMFYVVSGTPSRVFPLSTEPERLFSAADSASAQYVVIDYLDNLASFYLIPILEQRPEVFCTIQSFGGDQRGISTELLGLQTDAVADVEVSEGEAGTMSLTLSRCPAHMVAPAAGQSPTNSSPPRSSDPRVVPLLAGLDS